MKFYSKSNSDSFDALKRFLIWNPEMGHEGLIGAKNQKSYFELGEKFDYHFKVKFYGRGKSNGGSLDTLKQFILLGPEMRDKNPIRA